MCGKMTAATIQNVSWGAKFGSGAPAEMQALTVCRSATRNQSG